MHCWGDIDPFVCIVEVIQDELVGVKAIGLILLYLNSLLARIYAIDDP